MRGFHSTTHHRARGAVRGYTETGGATRRISIAFDEDTFLRIEAMAAKRQVPFAAVVRKIMTYAVEVEEEFEEGA